MELSCDKEDILFKCIDIYRKKYNCMSVIVLPHVVRYKNIEESCKRYCIPNYTEHVCNLFFFSHKFAKALWGEAKILLDDGTELFSWQHHLQQMVIYEDPFNYLKKFV